MNKNKNLYLYILAFFLTTQLSRWLVPMYGEKVRVIIAAIVLIGFVIEIVILVLKRKRYETIVTISLLIPMIIMGIGLYLDKLSLMIAGFGVLFLVIFIFIIIKNKYLKDRF